MVSIWVGYETITVTESTVLKHGSPTLLWHRATLVLAGWFTGPHVEK